MPHSAPSLLHPPQRTLPCVPLKALMFGRFAEQSSNTSHEAHDPVEVRSTEITTMYALNPEKSQHWFDLQLRQGHRHYTCFIGGGCKIKFGNAGLTTVHTRERQVQHHSEFVTLEEKVLRHVRHTFLPIRRDRAHSDDDQEH